MNDYPTIEFLLKCRRVLPIAMVALCIAAGGWLTLRLGVVDFLGAGAVAGAIGYILVRSYLELLSVISEMLIPK